MKLNPNNSMSNDETNKKINFSKRLKKKTELKPC
jgi:hypothetical protein